MKKFSMPTVGEIFENIRSLTNKHHFDLWLDWDLESLEIELKREASHSHDYTTRGDACSTMLAATLFKTLNTVFNETGDYTVEQKLDAVTLFQKEALGNNLSPVARKAVTGILVVLATVCALTVTVCINAAQNNLNPLAYLSQAQAIPLFLPIYALLLSAATMGAVKEQCNKSFKPREEPVDAITDKLKIKIEGDAEAEASSMSMTL